MIAAISSCPEQAYNAHWSGRIQSKICALASPQSTGAISLALGAKKGPPFRRALKVRTLAPRTLSAQDPTPSSHRGGEIFRRHSDKAALIGTIEAKSLIGVVRTSDDHQQQQKGTPATTEVGTGAL